ncbi:hypothetical protein RSJ42_11880 [Methanosarcina hadiensis]|uniref:hypothetical protein n=1 Tax=Methanosarcina hadiensis TaxID=3078083 RepID=UPI00397791CD
MPETTTIQITTETRDELRSIGRMGDDYNKVIRQLIEEHKEHLYRLNIDRIAEEAKKHFEEHRDEYVSIDDL